MAAHLFCRRSDTRHRTTVGAERGQVAGHEDQVRHLLAQQIRHDGHVGGTDGVLAHLARLIEGQGEGGAVFAVVQEGARGELNLVFLHRAVEVGKKVGVGPSLVGGVADFAGAFA